MLEERLLASVYGYGSHLDQINAMLECSTDAETGR